MEDAKVLFIDDSEVLLSNFKSILTVAGFDVEITTQTIGLGKFIKDKDIVVIDYHMPGVKGGDVAKSIRHATAHKQSPCELYLYTTDDEIAMVYKDLGFDGVFLNKGDSRALISQLRAACRRLRIQSMMADKGSGSA